MRVLESQWIGMHGLGLALLCAAAGCSSDDAGSGGSGGTGGSGGSSAGGTGGSGGSASGGASSAGSAGAAGNAGCESPPIDNEVEIAGAYLDDYGFSHRVDDALWRSGELLFHVLDHSNEGRWLVAQNDADNDFNPELYSRFEWVTANGVLHFCQSAFAAESESAARAAGRADADDLEAGCSGFPWSQLRPIAIAGSYTDDFGGTHEITPAAWVSGSSVFHLLRFSNDERWAIAHNDCDNPYSPGRYSRFEWVSGSGSGGGAGQAGAGGEGGAGGLGASVTYFCQVGYDLLSAEAAESLQSANADDLAGGCNGFPWSELSASDL